jgi:hypothetical protein
MRKSFIPEEKKPFISEESPSPLAPRAAPPNNEESKLVKAMERDLVRPLTEQEKLLVLEPGVRLKQPRS